MAYIGGGTFGESTETQCRVCGATFPISSSAARHAEYTPVCSQSCYHELPE